MNQTLRVAPFWFALLLLLSALQVGVTLTLAYFVALTLLENYLRVVVGVVAVGLIVVVDLAILYGLIQAVQRWEPSE